jgi:CRISPR-associated endonuclease Cas1
MAATQTVSQPRQSDNSLLPRHGVVTLFGYGIQVRVDRGHLVLEDGIGADRRCTRLPRVGHGLRRLVVIGTDGCISFAALRWLADQDASFVMLERDGKVLATTGPVRPSEAKLRRAQGLAHHSGVALSITRELIARKLKGQEEVARHKLLDPATADKIRHLTNELPMAESIASVRLIESQAALAYWSAWRNLQINFPKNHLQRVPGHWCCFGARISPLTGSPRLSVNPANAMLNYLYAVLESEARLAAAALGLDPGLGVLHADLANRDSLALDLLEPVRPQVDSYLLDWLTKGTLRREWFLEQGNGNCRLMASLAMRLSETAPVWGRTVAPVAEWVAQALWNSTRKTVPTGPSLPTRLTQRRRSEGRGKEFVLKATSAPPAPNVCSGCGATTHEGRLCPTCGRQVSGEKLIELARRGRVAAQNPQSRLKRSESQRKHEAAKRVWRLSSNNPWPDERTYSTEIFPRLRSVTIASISSSLHVCESYAADIRAGRRRPHPRHWQKLAELANVRPPRRAKSN